jgi:hypothetical protein
MVIITNNIKSELFSYLSSHTYDKIFVLTDTCTYEKCLPLIIGLFTDDTFPPPLKFPSTKSPWAGLNSPPAEAPWSSFNSPPAEAPWAGLNSPPAEGSGGGFNFQFSIFNSQLKITPPTAASSIVLTAPHLKK